MTKRVPIKTKTDKDFFIEYGYGYADLMDIFDVSKQQAFMYLRGEYKPSTERLREVALRNPGEMEGKMCREILAGRGFVILEEKAVEA